MIHTKIDNPQIIGPLVLIWAKLSQKAFIVSNIMCDRFEENK